MSRTRHALIALVLMATTAVGADALRPTQLLASIRPTRIDLDAQVPSAFGDWRIDHDAVAPVEDPQVQETLDRIYSQWIARTYVNSQGQRVMLVIAYGADQRRRNGLNLHQPEICYPAQGFEIRTNVVASLSLGATSIEVRRLETVLDSRRYEPVTYWLMTGEYPNVGGLARREIDFRYGVRRIVPDGMLVRVSSIGRDTASQFALQTRFIQDLLAQASARTRAELVGNRSTGGHAS